MRNKEIIKKIGAGALAAVMTVSSISVNAAEINVADTTEVTNEVVNETTDETDTESAETSSAETSDENESTEITGESSNEESYETSVETSTESTENSTETYESAENQIKIKSDKADILFVSDLESLKNNTLEDPDPEVEDTNDYEAELNAAKDVLPEEYTSLLSNDTYSLLMKQEHKYNASDIVDFYVVPDDGYEVESIKATDAYGELQIIDYENGLYEITMPSDEVTINVNVKEETEEISDESSEDIENSEETDEESSEETSEHFLEKEEGTDSLDASLFSSQRLVVLASDAEDIIDPEHLIGEYDNVYLLNYSSVDQTMNAYAYYIDHADAVEPDTAVTAASDVTEETDTSDVNEDTTEATPEAVEETTEQTEEATETVEETTEPVDEAEEVFEKSLEMTGETSSDETETPTDVTATDIDNPISTLAGEQDSVAQDENGVIALLDTGAEGENVVDQVTMIDGNLVGDSTHGSDMAAAITEQNPDAKILSVRVIGDDNMGTVSSIVAGIEYAVAQDVDYINMSLYARKTLSNSVIASEIQKAVDAGIQVVGAAGNDGADVINYMPGSVDSAWILGACDEEGNRIESSNYGSTVDYNVVADSTSVAAAKFTGYISKNGTENISSDVIFNTDGTVSGEADDLTDEDGSLKPATASGTKTMGTSIGWTYAQTAFSSRDCGGNVSVKVVSGKVTNQSSEHPNYKKMAANTVVEVTLPKCGYTVVDGKRVPLTVKMTVTAGSNGFGYHVFDNDFLFATQYMYDSISSGKFTAKVECKFYNANTNASIAVKGVGTFRDIDENEGIKFVSSVDGLYTSSDSWLYKTSDGYWTSTKSTQTGDKSGDTEMAQDILFAYNVSAGSSFTFNIWAGSAGHPREDDFGEEHLKVTYKVVGTLPIINGKTATSSAVTPASYQFAYGANTVNGKSTILNNYVTVPGYTFSGWKTSASGSTVSGTFSGNSAQKTNINLYGTYTKNTGTVNVTKKLSGPSSVLNDLTDAQKTFTFTLSGTAADGETIKKTLTIVGTTDGASKQFTNVPVGTYTVKETTKSGWRCSNDTRSVTVEKGKTHQLTYINYVNTGSLEITKNISGVDESALSDAEKTFTFTLTGTSTVGAEVNQTQTLVGSGTVTFDSIPVGTYTVTESCDHTWSTDKTSQSVTITKDTKSTISYTNTYNPNRVAQPGPVKSLNLKWEKDEILDRQRIERRSDEVTFKIFQQVNASKSDVVAPQKLTVTDKLDSAFNYKGFKAYVSTDNGATWTEDTAFKDSKNGNTISISKSASMKDAAIYRFDITVNVDNDYDLESYIQKDSEGHDIYVIPNKASTTFEYVDNDPKTVTKETNEVTVYYPIDKVNIVVNKTNEVTGENISNAEFTVYEWDGKDYNIDDGKMGYEKDQKYHLHGIRKTDTNLGKFKIVETLTPEGYVGSWSKEVVVEGTSVEFTYNATNDMAKGTITVIKNDKYGNGLSGASYSIKAKEDIVSPEGKVLVQAGTEVDKVTTGNDGTAKSKELYPGKYTVTEINAPLGYALNSASQDVEVKYKDKDTKVTNTNVTFVNEKLYSKITVTKEIDTADIVWAHGNPTFTFKVTGKDLLGETHTYYQTVEFTSSNVGSGSKSTLSAVFNVPAGTYTVSEEKTARYKFGSIHDVVNGTVSGETAVIDVSGKKDGTDTQGASGAATFYNIKTTDEDLTHTSYVCNTIA